MSLINKVLQDLDKRGNSTQIGDATDAWFMIEADAAPCCWQSQG